MLNQFRKYYKDNKDLFEGGKILLAVSGGKDSVVMAHLFASLQIEFGVAHCNFKLRGADADQDEIFVKALADKLNVPFHKISFNTNTYASEKGISIQMAARELRYEWFDKILEEYNYQLIATAHHKNDVAETMLINLTKGTGISGLHGIKMRKNTLLRPLLDFTRKEIDTFAKENNIEFREDLSNHDVKYIRNKIRHKVIPLLEEVNSNLIDTLYTESKQFLELEQIIEQKIDIERKACFVNEKDNVKINIRELLQLTPLKTYLYYFLKEYEFSISDVSDIIRGLSNESGKTYYSNKYLLVKDRDYLIISKKKEKVETSYKIEKVTDFAGLPIPIIAKVVQKKQPFKIDTISSKAFLDIKQLTFPMIIRKWKKGDYFYPLGLKGKKKKLSDFFIDNKLSLIEKEELWILESNEQVVWVVGYRISDLFKLTKSTEEVLILNVTD